MLTKDHAHHWAADMGAYFGEGVEIEHCDVDDCEASRVPCSIKECPEYLDPEHCQYNNDDEPVPVCDRHAVRT